MTSYAKMPDGLILPETIARSVLTDYFFGNHGAYRSASGRNKNTIGWETTNGSADADTLADLPTVRQQSRDLCRNEALPSGAISTVVSAVVGTGIVPQSRIDYEYLGITQEEADVKQRQLERVFNHWASKNHCDIERKHTFWQSQALVKRSQLESGDVGINRRYKLNKTSKLGTAFQIIESDRIATPIDKAADQKVRAGIKLDEDGAPVSYYVLQIHPGEALYQSRYSMTDFTEVPAFDSRGYHQMLLVTRRTRPGQTRGMPYLAPVIEPLKQLGRYTEAEITAAVISGMFSVFVTSDAPTSPLGPGIPGIPGMVRGQQVVPQGNKIQKLQSGMIVDLKPGEKIETVSATRPNTAFDPFVMSVLRQIGVGLELPFEILIKHYTASYSAARAAIIEAWRFFLREREDLNQDYNQPVWEWVITEAIALGLVDAPGFFDDPMIRDAWLACDWIGQGMPQIDPLKEALAAQEWNNLGIWSLQDISAQQGRDYDRTFNQIVRERDARKKAGLDIEVTPNVQPSTQRADGTKAQAREDLIAKLLLENE